MDGTGAQNDPYLVETVADFEFIADFDDNKGKYFKQIADLNFGNIDTSLWDGFAGFYDGDGKEMKNANITGNGLFAWIYDNGGTPAKVENIIFRDCKNTNEPDGWNKAIVAGQLSGNSVVENCLFLDCEVLGLYAGGVISELTAGKIKGCHYRGKVGNDEDDWVAGGIVSDIQPPLTGGIAYVENCSFIGTVYSPGLSGLLGGIAGQAQALYAGTQVEITDCFARGTIEGDEHIGGIVGGAAGSGVGRTVYIRRCYSTTNCISDTGPEDGIVATLGANAHVVNCYSIHTTAHGEQRTAAHMKYPYTTKHAGGTYEDWGFEEEHILDLTDYDFEFGEPWMHDVEPEKNNGYPYINEGVLLLIPVASPEDLDHVRGGIAAHTFAEGTEWEVTLQAGNYGLDSNYIQVADIDMDGVAWTPIGSAYWRVDPSECFRGTFNGTEYTIRDLGSSLFGHTLDAEIRNVKVRGNPTITTVEYRGGFAEMICGGLTENCSFEGDITITDTDDCWGVGGFAGAVTDVLHHVDEPYASQKTVVKKCYAKGTVSGEAGDAAIGGFTGWGWCGIWTSGPVPYPLSKGVIIENCFARVDLSTTHDWERGAGGFIGIGEPSRADLELMHCYSTGAVPNYDNSGGFYGTLSISMQNHANHDVYDVIDTNNYWDTETSGRNDSDHAEPRTTAEMTYPENFVTTYIDWDFDTIWTHDPTYTVNDGYPPFKAIVGFNIWVKKGGVWHPVTDVWVKRGGVWNPVTDVSTKKGGVWNPV